MSDLGHDEPRVRPVAPTHAGGPQTQPKPAVVLAVVVVGVLATLYFLGSGTAAGPVTGSTTTVASEPSTTTMIAVATSEATTTLVPEATLHDLLPEASGVLVAAITARTRIDLELVRWQAASPPRAAPIPMLAGPVLDFDSSGQHMAFLGPSATVEGPTLYVGRLDGWAPAGVGVSSFRWHATLPGRIAWIEPGDPVRLCWADADSAEGLSVATCVPGIGTQLVGFDTRGFVVVDSAGRTVDRLDTAGRPTAALPGTDALIGPDGRVLIVGRALSGGESSFSLADPDLTEAVELDWAPTNSWGGFGYVAWSPVRHPAELAFLVYSEGEGRLLRWGLDGSPRQPVPFSGRVWDVTWDSTGRYVLLPGVLYETDHVLQVYDTFAETLVAIPFDNWIQDAHLITPAGCQDASHVSAVFADGLPEDVSLAMAQMVLSRDPSLESWYFMSARVVGGPFGGELASWAHPGFNGTDVSGNVPGLAVPINEAARSLGFGMTSLDPVDYGVDDWFQLDGAVASQQCVPPADPR